MINAAAILTSVHQLLNGELDVERVTYVSLLDPGHAPFAGLAMSKPRYEISLESLGANESTPIGAIGSHRLDDLLITVECHHKFKSRIQIDKRRNTLANALYHADVVKQALGYPENIRRCAGGTATDIVSGMLLDVERDVVAEDWDEGELVTAISGRAIVRITQAT